MSPNEYLDQIVRPNLAALQQDFGSLRRALNVIHSIDALAAHIFVAVRPLPGIRDDTGYREGLAARNKDFALLRDVAKGGKACGTSAGKAIGLQCHPDDLAGAWLGRGSLG
jgi:hypothetical protein